MTQIPAGWFPDPEPGQADRLRYWDGQLWTEHTHPVTPGYAGPGGRVVKTTPDGAPLAGWWMRVGASVLDFLILTPIMVLAAVPVIASQWDSITENIRQSAEAFETGAPPPLDPEIFSVGSPSWVALIVVLGGISVTYTLGFWRWKQATPGKLILGLRIRRREAAGPMPWSTMLIRFAVVNVLILTGDNQVLYWTVFGFLLLNYLWPLWDDKNQALHDKAARTNVVVQR